MQRMSIGQPADTMPEGGDGRDGMKPRPIRNIEPLGPALRGATTDRINDDAPGIGTNRNIPVPGDPISEGPEPPLPTRNQPVQGDPIDEYPPDGSGETMLYRNPLSAQPELPAEEQPYDPDSGPREATPGSVGAQILSAPKRNEDIPGPDLGPGGFPIVDQPAGNGPWLSETTAPAAPEPDPSMGLGIDPARGRLGDAVATVGEAATAGGRAAHEAAVEPPTVTNALPALRGLKIVQDAQQAFGDVVGRRVAESLGWSNDEIANVLGQSIGAQDIAGFVGGAALDPTNYIGAPGIDDAIRVAGPVARRAAGAASEAVRGAGRAISEGAQDAGRAAIDAVDSTGRRLSEGLAANAERTTAATARMAREGGQPAYGTFGMSPNGPRRGRVPSEQELRSEFGTPIQEAPDAIRGPDSVERVQAARGETPYDNSAVPPNFDQQPLVRDDAPRGGDVNLNASAGAVPAARSTDRLGAVNNVLSQGLASAFSGGVGAQVNQQMDPDDPYAGVKGFAAGALIPQLATRGVRAGLKAAGKDAEGASGALATVGAAPGGPRRFADPADALGAARAAIGTPNPKGPTTGLSRMEALRRWVVRMGTDNKVDVAALQQEAQRLLGRPLEADEMLLELTRANPSGAAKVMIDDAIKPAVREVGAERENLSTLMRLLNNTDVAAATGNPDRAFSGGLTGADSQAAAAHLWSTLAPEAQKAIDTSSDALYRVVDHYRDEMVRAGVWTPTLAAELKSKYPHWVPTKILDYMNDPATVSTGSRSISLRDRGLRAYSIDGTAKAAEDPIASLVRYVQDAESIVQKNEAFNAFANLRDRVPGWDALMREVPSNTTPSRANGEKAVTGFVNGERKTFMVPAPMAAAIQMEQGQQVPILREMTQLFKEFITRTPMFVAGQVPLDAFGYAVRESAREGGPLAAPRVAAELARGYVEAFRGLLDGSFKGDAARYLKEGGGMAGFYERSASAASQTVDDLTRRHMFEVRNAADAKQLTGWLLGGGWVQAVGARTELAPRVASFRLGERRALKAGASAEKAALEGMVGARDVTLDFQRGGAAAKVANQIIPFFNVGIQSATTLPRMLRENPKGAVATMLSLVAAPTLAAEAWNRMDPKRSADYDDVPDYVKDRGIVVMLPGVEGKDDRGERRPNYALVPLRELAPVAILARDLMQGAMGTSRRGALETAQAILGAASPVQASGAADLFSSVLAPVASTGLQLAADRDFFRGGPIATTRRDEDASALATGMASATGYRKSQADFFIRDVFGGAGAMASAASDLATGKRKDEQRIQSAPLVGGLISRFVGDSVGGNLTRAQDAMRTPELSAVLRDVGLRSDQLAPLDAKGPNDFPFTRQEQARAQQLMNRYLTEANGLANVSSAIPNWSSLSQQAKQNIVRDAAAAARKRAEGEVLSGIPEADRQRRFEAARQKKAR